MANKKVFNLQALDLEQLALCYGLSIAPSIEHLTDQQKQQQQQGDESSPAFSGGAVASGEHKKKNMSKLARLKVRYAFELAATLVVAAAVCATGADVFDLFFHRSFRLFHFW